LNHCCRNRLRKYLKLLKFFKLKMSLYFLFFVFICFCFVSVVVLNHRSHPLSLLFLFSIFLSKIQGRSGYVLICRASAVQIFFFAQLKIIFFPNGKKHRPLLSDFFFAPPKIWLLLRPCQNLVNPFLIYIHTHFLFLF